jgi:hypothetical protein
MSPKYAPSNLLKVITILCMKFTIATVINKTANKIKKEAKIQVMWSMNITDIKDNRRLALHLFYCKLQ